MIEFTIGLLLEILAAMIGAMVAVVMWVLFSYYIEKQPLKRAIRDGLIFGIFLFFWVWYGPIIVDLLYDLLFK